MSNRSPSIQKWVATGIVALVLFTALALFAKDYTINKFMSLAAAKARWGSERFDVKKFRDGDAKVKSTMVVSMIEGKQMLGKDLSSIRATLGPYSGHYWSDEIPTYIVEEGWETNKDTWQIVFVPDKSKKVKEIKIHKNCCDTN